MDFEAFPAVVADLADAGVPEDGDIGTSRSSAWLSNHRHGVIFSVKSPFHPLLFRLRRIAGKGLKHAHAVALEVKRMRRPRGLLVLVMTAQPVRGVELRSTLGCEIDVVMRAKQDVEVRAHRRNR